ncbi:MAG: delta-60 repeat domain-containing protein [Spirochaetales bacterium]|nr:delta-60 repeat domain-containing protein [Spirochaetales bacterium]
MINKLTGSFFAVLLCVTAVFSCDPGVQPPDGPVTPVVLLPGDNSEVPEPPASVPGPSGEIDIAFLPQVNVATDGIVYIAETRDSTLYIGGEFTKLYPQRGHCFPVNAATGNAALDPAVVNKVNGPVYAMVSDNNGGFYIGGEFSKVGGYNRYNIARINADGSVHEWTADTNGAVRAIAVNGSTVYYGGDFTQVKIYDRLHAAASDAVSGVVLPWNPSADGSVRAMAMAQNNDDFPIVYLGGSFETVGGGSHPYFALVYADGSGALASSMLIGPNAPVECMIVANTPYYPQTLIVGGSFTAWNSEPANKLVFLDAEKPVGMRPFSGISGTSVNTAVWDNDMLYIGGKFSQVGTASRNNIAAVGIDGTTVYPWNPDLQFPNDGCVNKILINAESAVFVAGNFSMNSTEGFPSAGIPIQHDHLLKLDKTTGLQTAWSMECNNEVNALGISGSLLFVGGANTTSKSIPRNNIAAINMITGMPTAWNPGADAMVYRILPSKNALFVSGLFQNIGGQERHFLAALDPVTGEAYPWNPSPDDIPMVLTLKGNNLYVGGPFTQIDGLARHCFALFDIQVGHVTELQFRFNQGSYTPCVASIEENDGFIYIGGFFSWVNDIPYMSLLRVNAATGVIDSWNPLVDYCELGVIAKMIFKNNILYTCGTFFSGMEDGDGITNMAGFIPVHLDSGVQEDLIITGAYFMDMELSGNTMFFAMRDFDYNGVLRNKLAAVNLETKTVLDWSPPIGEDDNEDVLDLKICNTVVIISGRFITFNGEKQPGIATWTESTSGR